MASVINKDGMECAGSLSAAEGELLVLAFTLALHSVSSYNGPLVIDTPVAKISGDLRKSFAKVLKRVSEKKQVVLFITNDEYSDNIKDVFEADVNRKYELHLKGSDYVECNEG